MVMVMVVVEAVLMWTASDWKSIVALNKDDNKQRFTELSTWSKSDQDHSKTGYIMKASYFVPYTSLHYLLTSVVNSYMHANSVSAREWHGLAI